MVVEKEIFDVIKQGVLSEDGSEYFLPNIQLDRKLYLNVNKILLSFGLKWNKKSKSHISNIDVSEKWYNMIDTGEWTDVKSELQYFPTPKNIVGNMINMVDWKEDIKVLEPSGGIGNIAFLLPDKKLNIDIIEINKDFTDEMIINCPKNSNIYNIINSDFMELEQNDKYDVIIANPPFTKLQSVKHFNKMVEMLSDNGQLVCVLPVSDYDKNSSINLRKKLTEFIDNNNCQVVYLNNGDFKESGTMVKTIILKYTK